MAEESTGQESGDDREDREDRRATALLEALRIAVVFALPDEDQTAPQRAGVRETVVIIRDEYAEDLPEFAAYMDSLNARDLEWHRIVSGWVDETPVYLHANIELSLAIDWPMADDVPLQGGAHQRRVDAILDLLETPASASDLQSVSTGLTHFAAGDGTPTNVSLTGSSYNSGVNHDPDGDSTGTAISIPQP